MLKFGSITAVFRGITSAKKREIIIRMIQLRSVFCLSSSEFITVFPINASGARSLAKRLTFPTFTRKREKVFERRKIGTRILEESQRQAARNKRKKAMSGA